MNTSLQKKTVRAHRKWLIGVAVVIAVAAVSARLFLPELNMIGQMHNGELVEADYWHEEPKILSAGMGFDNIIGISDISVDAVRAAGGAWYANLQCGNGKRPSDNARTSAVPVDTIGGFAKGFADYDDGLPIVFSWPVATESVDVTDFRFTLNNGEIAVPHSVTMVPNWELNERNTVVVFGEFGNRGYRHEPDAIFPVVLEIVADSTPLHLVGPDGVEFNAVGLTWETDTGPYDNGPRLVGAKLNHLSRPEHSEIGSRTIGEGGVSLLTRVQGTLPNHAAALYDVGDFRLRVLTSGGFSPDGVTGLRPDMFDQFFRLHAQDGQGNKIILTATGQDYDVAGGQLRVVGLSDLGQRANAAKGIIYDDCYAEDRDNYIDIILSGDEIAARAITHVEIPALAGGYRAFFNPGGPGPEPFEGTRYTAPGPPDLEPVIMALDNPMRVSRAPRN